jgi:cysteinyl-tRNA synthetase
MSELPVPRLYNTLSRQVEPLALQDPGFVRMYVCGVTVYNLCHIGHARAYVAFDTLYRALKHLGYQVKYVRNFTDVDDKIIKAANEEGVDPLELSERYIQTFHEDMEALGVLKADVEPKVSEHIDEIIAMTEKLIERGHAYAVEGDVYFAVRSMPDYGKLGRRDLDDLRAGARVEIDENKRDPLDFALWKAKKPGEPAWKSPWGEGRPGWHIECSAMSTTHLGTTLDIHGGGSDLIFPHHENEIAQSECATGQPFSSHWCHNGFVNIDDEKMSKSLGNFFTIREVLERYDGEAIRYFLLTTHYRQPINFSQKPLDEASQRVAYLYTSLAKLSQRLEQAGEAALERAPLEEFDLLSRSQDALLDDLNTPQLLGILADGLRKANELIDHPPASKGERKRVPATLAQLQAQLHPLLEVLGLARQSPVVWLQTRRDRRAQALQLNIDEVEALVAQRFAAKQERNFEEADRLRDQLNALGIDLFDRRDGTDWDIREATELV